MAGVVVAPGGQYLNTDSGLGGILDKITGDIDAASANRDQLRGLAAGGVIPASGAPAPSLFSRLLGVGVDGTPAAQPGIIPTAANAAVGAAANALPNLPTFAAAGAPTSALPPPGVVASYVGQSAAARGIDPMVAIRVAQSEGGLRNPGISGDNGSSHGPFQLHVGGVAGGANSVGGLGDDFARATGLDPADPANWQKTVDFALDHAKVNGWGAFHGAARAGIAPMAGIGVVPPAPGAQQTQVAATAPPPGAPPPRAMAYAPGNGVAPPAIQAITAATAPAPGGAPGPAPSVSTPPPASGGQPSAAPATPPAPNAGAPAPQPPQQVAMNGPATSPPAGSTPPAGASAAPPPMPLATADRGTVADAQPVPAAAPPNVLGAGAQLPNIQQIQALIQNPATRQIGLQMWQTALTPKPTIKLGQGEREYDSRGNQIAANPAAPVSVAAGTSLVSPSTGQPLFTGRPNLEVKQTGVDALGNPSYGTFNPQSGAVAPIGQGGGSQNPITGNLLQSMGLDTSKTGEAFLQQVDPALANTVRAIVSGREPSPAGKERNSGTGRIITALVNQVDPQFESSNGPTRNAVYQAYSDPDKPVGAAINAGNSAIAHLGELAEKGESLSSGQFPALNSISNLVGQQLGNNTAYTDYNNVLGKYVEEVTKFYRGSGGTESDLARDMANLSPNMSPDQRRSALASQAALIQGKVGALQSQYQHAMGPMAQPFPILQPHSLDVLGRVIGRVPGAQPGGAPPPAPVPGPQGASPQVPDPAAAVAAAKSAIAAGADRGKVIQRMQSMGLPVGGL